MNSTLQLQLRYDLDLDLWHYQDPGLNGFFSSVGNFVKDVVKIGAQPITSSVSSITGRDIDLKYDTKVGATVGGSVKVGTDSVHVALKSYADTVTGGYASKAVNVIRKDEYKESPGNYQELRNKTFTSGPLSKFENISKGGAAIIGSAAGQIFGGGGGGGVSSTIPQIESPLAPAPLLPNQAEQQQVVVVQQQEEENKSLEASTGIKLNPVTVSIALVLLTGAAVMAVRERRKNKGT